MNGSWAKRKRSRRCALIGCVIAAGAVFAGCNPAGSYDGSLASGQSRLMVTNQTSWQCGVSIERLDKKPRSAAAEILVILAPNEEYTWDLPAGKYRLAATKLDPPTKGFSKTYDAKPGIHRVWPLLDLSKRKP